MLVRNTVHVKEVVKISVVSLVVILAAHRDSLVLVTASLTT